MAQKLHTFRAETLEAAYQQMRQKLGDSAVVLRTAETKEGGLFGMMGRKMVELTAAPPEPPARPAPPRHPAHAVRRYADTTRVGSDETVRETVTYFKELVTDAQRRMGIANTQSTPPQRPAPPTPPQPQTQRPPSGGNAPFLATGGGTQAVRATNPVIPFPGTKEGTEPSETLRQELRELRNLVEVLIAEAPGAGMPAEFAPHYRALVEAGVSRPVAASLMGALLKGSDLSILRDPNRLQDRLREETAARIQVTGGIVLKKGPARIVAMVGPTGVGKTTNVAKLAAVHAVRQRARVALITADTYRVAAPEQLRTYANIIGLPLQVVNSPKEIAGALRTFRDQDLVLIDTPGGSPYNLKQMQELKDILDAARPDDILLVLAATTPLEDMRGVVEKFRAVSPTAVLFSKLDETQRYGAVLSALVESGLPASYLSVGQNVPEDIYVAKSEAMAGLVVKGGEKRGISSPKSA